MAFHFTSWSRVALASSWLLVLVIAACPHPAMAQSTSDSVNPSAGQQLEQLRGQAVAENSAGNDLAAARTAERILVLERQLYGPTSSEVLYTLDWIFWRYLNAADYSAAGRVTAERIEILKRNYGEKHWQVISAVRRLEFVTRYQQAAPELRKANDELQAKIKQHRDQREYSQAISLGKQLDEVASKILGEDLPEYANVQITLSSLYLGNEDYATAARHAERALAIRKQSLGPKHPDTATGMALVAECYAALEQSDRAIDLMKGCLEIRQEVLGDDDNATAAAIDHLANLYTSAGRTDDAIQLRQSTRTAARERSRRLNELEASLTEARRLYSAGEVNAAIEEYLKAIRLTIQVYGELSAREYGIVDSLRALYLRVDDMAGARYSANRLHSVALKQFGPTDKRTITARFYREFVDRYSALSSDQRRQYQSQTLQFSEHVENRRCAQAIDIAQDLLPDTRRLAAGPLTAQILSDLGRCHGHLEQLEQAIEYLQESHSLFESVFGPDDDETVESLIFLAGAHRANHDYGTASRLYEQAYEVASRSQQHDSDATLRILSDLSELKSDLGDYDAAAEYATRRYEACQRRFGDDHSETVKAESKLGVIYDQSGDYVRALPHLERVLQWTTRTGNGASRVTALNNLAGVHLSMNDYVKGADYLEQALEYARIEDPEEKAEITLDIMGNLGLVYRSVDKTEQAELLLDQSLKGLREIHGGDSRELILPLTRRAMLHEDKKEWDRAKSLYNTALEIALQRLGESHPDSIGVLGELGDLYVSREEIEKAEEFYSRALKGALESLGEDHPRVAVYRSDLAEVHCFNGEFQEAEELLRLALAQRTRLRRHTFAVQSERQQMEMASKGRHTLDAWLSIASRASVSDEEMYRKLVEWKGAVYARQRFQRTRRNSPELSPLFRELEEVSLQLSRHGRDSQSGSHADVDQLRERHEALEKLLATSSPTFRADQQFGDGGRQLRTLLPPGTAFVDIFEYAHTPDRAVNLDSSERRFIAFVHKGDAEIKRVELGTSASIAEQIDVWRHAILDSRGGVTDAVDPSERASYQLRDLIWTPLEAHLGGITHVVLSPDGVASHIPFAALPGHAPGKYLLEEIAITLIPSHRALLDVLLADQSHEAAKGESLLLVGGVDFEASPGHAGQSVATSRSAPRYAATGFRPLPGTVQEIQGIGQVFAVRSFSDRGGASFSLDVLRGPDATEQAFRQQALRNRYLHLATHGFFADESQQGELSSHSDDDADPSTLRHPGLLSGVALSGANRGTTGDGVDASLDDGILTALEVANLDLRGVELVVLSACESGLGRVQQGEGVLGLQRAFQTAGVRTTVTSLWSVDDQATQMLMNEVYQNIWERGLPRGEALRQAQLVMLHQYDADRKRLRRGADPVAVEASEAESLSPYYWAAFVLSGDWR